MEELTRLPSLRDVLILNGSEGALVSAVDSCGGVGSLPYDALYTPPETVGELTARTALLEILCTGARPLFGAVGISNDPALAQSLLAGVRSVVGESLPLIVSTEKNFKTEMTGMSVTLTGRCSLEELLVGRARAGDILYCAGAPLMGEGVLQNPGHLPPPEWVAKAISQPGVRAALPVGSRGIRAEAELLAKESGLAPVFERTDIDLDRSAGPSACVLFAAEPGALDGTQGIPVARIARLA